MDKTKEVKNVKKVWRVFADLVDHTISKVGRKYN